ncbi:SM-like, degradation of cytoplasmic mRNAs and positively regulates transcription initiation [Phytophthora boehmeriae]|uniref:U6 snRNA-associated Sm-like protein LSm1 n=1 Tax=Phytophthora boehmeriae TaxID=109152 RepID=A0A8T1WV98_9STRA|nr:SM-like, degradation of cytoplasmic mRNAs and positively regulates transcription initiation [Phytophthora boehmeriae]
MSGIFPGNSSLIQQLDKQVLMVLRDGRHLVGYLRSFDQFSNIILEDTYERHVAGGLFCDIELGLNIIRGDNIVLLGELDPEKERDQPHMKRVELEEVLEAEEKLNDEGSASVRQQWDFEQQH